MYKKVPITKTGEHIWDARKAEKNDELEIAEDRITDREENSKSVDWNDNFEILNVPCPYCHTTTRLYKRTDVHYMEYIVHCQKCKRQVKV